MSGAESPSSSQGGSEASEWGPSWTKELMDLPAELHFEIFSHCEDYASAVALRLTSRHFDSIYRRDEDRILTAIAKRVIAPFREFYDFLVRLRLPAESVHHAPPEGWPSISPEICWGAEADSNASKKVEGDSDTDPAAEDKPKGFDKTRFAITVLKHLSYINGGSQDNETNIGYKCNVADYSKFGPESWAGMDDEVFWATEWQDLSEDDPWEPFEGDRISPLKHVVMLADGYESGGIVLLLDTWTGTVFEEVIRCNNGDRLSTAEYCKDRIESCTTLKEVFLPGEEPLGGELPDKYDPEEMERKGEPSAGTDDEDEAQVAWARHLHWKFGWPGEKWDKEGCLEALSAFCERWYEYA